MKSGFYGLIPKVVRHHKELKSNTKLLYAEISACINEDGVCTEKNIYFQKVLNIGKTTLDSSLRQLRLHGFIQIVMEIEENSKKKYDSVTETINNNVNEINNLIKSTPEYKIGKEILEGDIDVEPTTADKYNKEWLDEKGSES